MKIFILIMILLTFTMSADAALPDQSCVYVNSYSDTAYVIWTTNIEADNRVEYSENQDMSSSSWSSWDNDSTDPKILLTGLTRDISYYYNISSTNAGDTNVTSGKSFSTHNNTHGFSQYFDQAFIVNPIDGWGVGQSMTGAYTESVGDYVFWTLFLLPIFVVIMIRTESTVIPVTLALVGSLFLFPLLPPEQAAPIKILIGLAVAGILWHLYIGRR